MNKNGFTLIELLATIVILSMIGLITIPLIMNVIEDSKMGAFRNSAYGIVRATENVHLKALIENNQLNEEIFYYSGGIESNSSNIKLNYKGQRPTTGYIELNTKNEVRLWLWWSGFCAVKGLNSSEVTVTKIASSDCGEESLPPTIIFEGYTNTADVVLTFLPEDEIDLPNVSAYDFYGTDITEDITETSNLDEGVPGSYTINYSVTDINNNTTTRSMTVNIIDNIAPVINFNPNTNETYLKQQGSTVSIVDDSNLDNSSLKYLWSTLNIEPNESDFIEVFSNNTLISDTNNTRTGDYYLWVIAKDEHGNTTISSSEVFKFDNTAPTLSFPTPITILTSEVGTFDMWAGVTYSDAHSGVSTNTVSGSLSIIPGSYELTYIITDNAGNETTQTRTVVVQDSEAPVITLNGNNPMNINVGTAYTEPGYSALDNVDGNVTASVVVTGSVNPNIPGSYTINYSVTDSSDNSGSATRTVNVIDNVAPIITLSGTNPININVGTTYTEPGYSATDNADGNITNNVVVTGSVNSNIHGSYTINYSVTDSSGNIGSATRTVNVIDNLAPVITFSPNGNNSWGHSHSTVVTAVDAHSSVTIRKYLWTTSSTQPSEATISTNFNTGATLTTPISVSGDYYLWILTEDVHGNKAINRSSVFKLDGVGPTISFGTNGDTTQKTSAVTTVSVADGVSGINGSSLKYLWNQTESGITEANFSSGTSFSNSGTISYTPTVNGLHYLWILAKDNAGNTTIVRSNSFNIGIGPNGYNLTFTVSTPTSSNGTIANFNLIPLSSASGNVTGYYFEEYKYKGSCLRTTPSTSPCARTGQINTHLSGKYLTYRLCAYNLYASSCGVWIRFYIAPKGSGYEALGPIGGTTFREPDDDTLLTYIRMGYYHMFN